MSFQALLARRQRVTIRRSTEVLSVTGASTRQWTTIATNVPFVIERSSGRQILTDPGRLVDSDHDGYCEQSVDLLVWDRVLDGDKTYDILLIEDLFSPFGPYADHRKLALALAPVPE